MPYFAATVERRDDAALAGRSLVIGGQPWEPWPVYAYSREVALSGVRPGMPLRQAHLLSPAAHFIPPAQPRYHLAAGEIVDVLTDFSHRIEPENLWQPFLDRAPLPLSSRLLPARYYVDLEGLPAGEAVPLVQQIGRTLRQETQLAPAIGLARHRFAAEVAATLARPNHALPVPAGAEEAFLASRSIHFLPLDEATRRRLRLLGIRKLGQLAALPAGSIRTQLGPEGERLYRLAQGEAVAPLAPLVREPELEVVYQFDDPLADSQRLGALLRRAAARLARRLQEAGLEGSVLTLTWETAEGDEQQQPIRLRQPTAQARLLATVLDEWQRQAAFRQGLAALAVTIGRLTPAAVRQLSLFRAAAPSQAQQTLAHLVLKHGAGCFYQATLSPRPQPLAERRFTLSPYAAAVL